MIPKKITFEQLTETSISTGFRKIKTFPLPDQRIIDRIKMYDFFYQKQWFEVEASPKPISKILPQ